MLSDVAPRTILRWFGCLGFALLFCGCREEIIHNLGEADATRIIARLQDLGVETTRSRQPDGRWSISVEGEDRALALRFVDTQRLLRDERPVPETGSLLASRDEQRFQYERSLSREIESTLLTLDGVLDARVHLNLPPTDPLLGQPAPTQKGSASVLLITGARFSAERAQIGTIVAGASGVPLDSVAVMFSKSEEPNPTTRVENSSTARPANTHNAAAWEDRRVIIALASLMLIVIGAGALYRNRRRPGPLQGPLPAIQ